MSYLLDVAGSSMLSWLWASIVHFFLSIGLPGLVVIGAGSILLISSCIKTFKFLQSVKGMTVTAVVFFAAIGWMWWMAGPLAAAIRPIIEASRRPPRVELPPSMLATKAFPVETPAPPLEELPTRSTGPGPIRAMPALPLGYPLVEATPVPTLLATPPAVVHVPPVAAAPGRHEPAHQPSAPAVSHQTQTHRSMASAAPINRAGGSIASHNRPMGGMGMPHTGAAAARQRNMQALGQMGAMNLNPFTGMPHFSGGHIGGHVGGHMGGMSHHGGHH